MGAYNRSLTGVKGHYEQKNISVTGFAARDTSRQVIEELPGLGISGPYYTSNTSFIINSEKVEIITRDRNQPSLVLKTLQQARFSDYEMDPFTGAILFKAPVPSMDEALNPNFIRVTYEIDQGGREFWVAGVEGQVKLAENIEVGGSYVRDENPQDKTDLMSLNAALKLADRTLIITEWAQTYRQSVGRGNGKRIEFRHDSEKLQARIYADNTDSGFDNPSAGITKGRLEAGLKINYRITPTTALRLEALHSEDTINSGKRDGALINIEQSFNKYLKAEFGLRYANETTTVSQPGSLGATPLNYYSGRIKLGVQVPQLPRLGVFGEYEQAFNDSSKKVAAVGGEYQFASLGRIYARHEFISSLTGTYGLNTNQQQNVTLVGIDAKYMKDGSLFSEYRIRDSISGRDAEAAVGLRNAWDIRKGLRLHTAFERVQSLNGTDTNGSTAVAAAVEYTADPLWKGSSRIELRKATGRNNILNTMGIAYKIDQSFTFLGKYIIDLLDNKGVTGDKYTGRLQLGLAYRPTDTNKWNLLSKYEFKYEKDSSLTDLSVRRSVHILSLHLNYQVSRPLIFSGRYAGKLAYDNSNGIRSRSYAHLLSARAIYDISKRWDVGVISSVLFSGGFRSYQYGLGGEIGYLVAKNLWLSAGYNAFGFVDQDLCTEEYTSSGPYFRMRYKFDEDIFNIFDKPGSDKTDNQKFEN